MGALTGILDVATLIVVALMVGVILNSRNAIGLVNAIGSSFTASLNAVSGTIR